MQELISGVNVGFGDVSFWTDLERSREKILKFNPSGNYRRTFTKENQQLLNALQNLPVMEDINIGTITKGTIERITKREIIINVNYKDSVFVENKTADLNVIENLKIGDEIDVIITEINETPYQLKGSITELIKMKVATKLKKSFNDNEPILAKVIEMIPAGFMLDIEMDNITIQAFMPNILSGVNRLTKEQSQELVGQKINVLLETLQQEKGVYVVSRKKYLQTLIPEEIKKIKRGDKLVGTITGTKSFGVFVQFNKCLTGMIHKVNLLPELQEKIEEIQSGTSIEFYVRDILKGNKIVLSQVIRQTLWDSIKLGQIRDAVVTGVKQFGILVALDDETYGLIQNSYIKNINTFSVGDKIKVKVVSIMRDDRKIYLIIID